MNNKYQVAYYSTYKDWANQPWLQGWPGYLCVIITGLLGVITKNSYLITFLSIISFLALLFCVFVTVFYANSILEITETGLSVTKNKKMTYFNWLDVSNVVFITPSSRASYREVVMVIYYRVDGNEMIDYVFIESLNFKWAHIKATEIGNLIETHLKGYIFKIHKSNFFAPIFLKRRNLVPTINP